MSICDWLRADRWTARIASRCKTSIGSMEMCLMNYLRITCVLCRYYYRSDGIERYDALINRRDTRRVD